MHAIKVIYNNIIGVANSSGRKPVEDGEVIAPTGRRNDDDDDDDARKAGSSMMIIIIILCFTKTTRVGILWSLVYQNIKQFIL